MESRVAGGERLAGEVLPGLPGNSVSEHPARGQNGEEQRRDDGNEELDDAEDKRQ